MKKLLLFLIVMIMVLSACASKREFQSSFVNMSKEKEGTIEKQIDIKNEEKPMELTVYMTGTLALLGKGQNQVRYHITDYSVGPYGPLTNAGQEHGHMFYDPIKEFERESGITINLQIFQNMETIEDQIVHVRCGGLSDSGVCAPSDFLRSLYEPDPRRLPDPRPVAEDMECVICLKLRM